MQVAFKAVYSLVVAGLFVLVVILGTMTFYAEPDQPQYQYPKGGDPTEQEQMEYARKSATYRNERQDYHRNVFTVMGFLGIAAVIVGLVLFQRVEAMPLGLMLGGVGVVTFGWTQSATAEDSGEMGVAPVFAIVAVGLVIVLAAGYRFLGAGRTPSSS